MFRSKKYSGNRKEDYQLLIEQLKALLAGEKNRIANLANAAALLNQFLSDTNWVGFYLFDGDLILGPFQGLPACTRIQLGKGVCGTAAKERKTICVDDVSQFEGHIACNAASQSELVIPLIKQREFIGVLDIDSPIVQRFDGLDIEGLEKFCETLISSL